VFKNCKFSFSCCLFFFFAECFRNFHPRNSRFTLCSCLFFCVLFFFFSSPTQLFCSLGLATLRGMEVIPHHISVQKHFTDFQNCSFFKLVMNKDLLKLGFRTGWGGSTGCIMQRVPTRGDGFGLKEKKKKGRYGRIVSDRHGHPLVLLINSLRPSLCDHWTHKLRDHWTQREATRRRCHDGERREKRREEDATIVGCDALPQTQVLKLRS
jgi:hypothetical protein